MIPNVDETIVIQTLEGFESKVFSAAFNGHVAKLLYDQLYTDKPRSITRELATNAYDSHIEAGCPERPFIIQLPNMLDSTFRVRDFGVSMTHEQTMELYTTIFASSKQDTNDLVGQFGLGSKSPFAYTDSFVVTCWRDEFKRVYVAALNADGMPVLTHLLTEPSDEETGMEVSFPVQARHFNDFKKAAKTVAMGFDIIPLGVDADPPVYSRDNWRIFETPDRHNVKLSIRQGCVNYPVNTYDVGVTDLVGGGYHLIVDVPIGVQAGGVDIIASREALSLDDETKANVKAAWAMARDSMLAFTKDIFEGSKNFLEASQRWLLLNNVFQSTAIDTSRWEKVGKIDGTIRMGGTRDPVLLTRKDDRKKVFSLHNLDDIIIVVDRGQKIPRRALRLAQFFRNANGNGLKMIEPPKKDIERVMRRLGLRADQFVSIVNIEDVPRPPSYSGPSTRAGIYRLTDTRALKHNELPSDKFYWLPISTGTVSGVTELFGESQEVRHVRGHLETAMQILEIPTLPIYGLLPQAIRRATKAGDIDESNRLDKMIQEKLDLIKDDHYLSHYWYHVKKGGMGYQERPHGHMSGIDFIITPAQQELIKKYHTGSHSYIVDNHCLYNRRDELKKAVDEKIEELYTAFPMLFTLVADDQIQEYIKQRTPKQCPLLMLTT